MNHRDATASDAFFEGLEDEFDIPSKYLSIFIDETEQTLDGLTEGCLALEGDVARADVQHLLVLSHRIKGSAAAVGLVRAAKLAHLMEDRLQGLRDAGGESYAGMADAMLQCVDSLREYLEKLKRGENASDCLAPAARNLLTTLNHAANANTDLSPTGVGDVLRARVAAVAPIDGSMVLGEVVFQPRVPLVGLKARLLFEKLSQLGDVRLFDPSVELLDDMDDLDRISFGLATEKMPGEVESFLWIAGVKRVAVEASRVEVATESGSRESAQSNKALSFAKTGKEDAGVSIAKPTPPSAFQGKPTETLRVDIDRLDQLMNLAGELVISKSRFSRVGDSFKQALGRSRSRCVLNDLTNALREMSTSVAVAEHAPSLRNELEQIRREARRVADGLESIRRDMDALAQVQGSIHELTDAVHQLHRVSEGIQHCVMDARMAPIGPLFARFRRVVRDVARSNGKSIRLVIRGESTELDKRMIDELGDPLIHLVRNAADHGIEPPSVRLAAGKPAEGLITLDARHRGNSILIEVSDDGQGVDAQRLLQKAIDLRVVREADAENMTPDRVHALIWEPGLSTAGKVTEVSGRGMGMDIVRDKIENLSGSIDVHSSPGEGMKITIKLPLTLAILPSLMVEIDSGVIAVPIESVVEIVHVPRDGVTRLFGHRTAHARGREVAMIHLDEIFHRDAAHLDTRNPEEGDSTLVILGDGRREIGLLVDRVLGEEAIVIKSIADNYQYIPGVAGASILGDGRVTLILDPPIVIDMASRPAGHLVRS